MNRKIEIKELKPYLYLLDESHESTGYLLIGDKKACVIDTMMGYNNLYETVKSYNRQAPDCDKYPWTPRPYIWKCVF